MKPAISSTVLFIGFLFGASGVNAQSADELFEEVLRDPDNVELNIDFGRAAEREGDDRHALAAYERAVRSDRANGMAYRNYERMRLRLSPPITSGRLSLGASFRTNVLQAADQFDTPSDGTVEARLDIRDERTIAKLRLRTHGNATARLHFDENDLDGGSIKAWTGPVFRPMKDIEVNVTGGGGLRFFDDNLLYYEMSGKAELAIIGDAPPQLLTLYAGYKEVNEKSGSSRTDGFFINLRGRFSHLNVLTSGDVIYLQPSVGFSDGSDSDFDQTNFNSAQVVRDAVDYGVRVSYFVPTFDDAVTLGAGARFHQTHFDQEISSGGSNRRDSRIEGTLHMIFKDLIQDNVDLRFDYRYERNLSNDPNEDFDNHVVGSKIVWKF